MADPVDPTPTPPDPDPSSYPTEMAPLEVETPRRAASAEFVVDAEVGSDAVLREAMDPANQSLGEALRLSFRILQVVILVLVVLFLASGFKTVHDGQSGVLTVWGKIVEVGGQRELSEGPHWSRWPYPIGEFVLIDVENRELPVARAFWPDVPPNVSTEQMVSQARTGDQLRPGRDGSLITKDGALAHLQMTASYEITQPARFIERMMSEAQAQRIVELALQRATVQVVVGFTVQEAVDRPEEVRSEIQLRAQETLDRVGTGIEIVRVTMSEPPIPPFAIQNVFGDFQQAKVRAARLVERARQGANETLIATAGANYRELAEIIDRYEEAFDRSDDEQSEVLLAEINGWLESDRASGVVSDTIKRSRAYVSEVESTLGSETRLFLAQLPNFQENPELVVAQLWSDAYAYVLSGSGTEKFFAPAGGAQFNLSILGLDEVQERRRKLRLMRLEQASQQGFADQYRPYITRAGDLREGAGRRLRVEDGEVKSGQEGR